jgi:DNA polymerase V
MRILAAARLTGRATAHLRDPAMLHSTTLTFLPASFALKLPLPLASFRVSAGFPSPADDYLEGRLDLNEYFIRRPAATFYVRVSGDSMRGAGIFDGDLLIVDRSAECSDGCVVVARLGDEFTLKRMLKKGDRVFLRPENENYQPIEVTEDSDCEIWGRVVGSVRRY